MWLIYLCKLPSFITKTSIISIYCNFKNYNSDMNTVLIDFFIRRYFKKFDIFFTTERKSWPGKNSK
jgi:hypothetical protein